MAKPRDKTKQSSAGATSQSDQDENDSRGSEAKPDPPGRGCPVGDMVLLWGIVLCLGIAVPYLATSVPTANRTDLIWWMTGVVYQAPPPDPEMDLPYFEAMKIALPQLKEMGVQAIRMIDFFPSDDQGNTVDYYKPNPAFGNREQFEAVINKLDYYGMKLVIDLPISYTSIAHEWFWEDRKRKSQDSSYLWSEKPMSDQEDITFFTHVLETWIRRGVDGFIFMDFDTLQLRKKNPGDSVNHIETEDPNQKRLNNIANLTKTFRELFDYYQDEYEGTVYFAAELSSQDEKMWHAVYEAGVDTIISHDTVLSSDILTSGQVNPYSLRNNINKVISKAPGNNWKSWQICSRTNIEEEVSDDRKILLNLIHLMLPGSAYLCASQLPIVTVGDEVNIPMDNFKKVAKWRNTPSMIWGDTETTLVDDEIFSFARFAYGRSYSRYLIITNFGSFAQKRNFTLKTDKLTVPDEGVIKHFACATPEGEAVEVPYEMDSIIHLNSTTIYPHCGLLVELILPPFI